MSATPQSNATLEDIARELRDRDNFVICGHVSPDGDCLGSELALMHALRSLGKRVACVFAKEAIVDDGLLFLPGIDEIVPAASYDGPCDTFIAVDVPTVERIGDASALQERAGFTVTIDHHAVDTRMSQASYTDPDAASTTMLVWEICGLLGVDRSGVIAECAYTGLATDTGGFRFQNADAAAFRAAADMVACGADPAAVAREVFQNRNIASFQLEALALERSTLLCDGAAIVSWLTLDDFTRFNASKADAEPIVTTLRSVRGIRVACLVREQDDMTIRGNLRSKDDTNVATIACQFGGGGHDAAAGFTTEGTLAEVLERVSRAIESEVGAVS